MFDSGYICTSTIDWVGQYIKIDTSKWPIIKWLPLVLKLVTCIKSIWVTLYGSHISEGLIGTFACKHFLRWKYSSLKGYYWSNYSCKTWFMCHTWLISFILRLRSSFIKMRGFNFERIKMEKHNSYSSMIWYNWWCHLLNLIFFCKRKCFFKSCEFGMVWKILSYELSTGWGHHIN